MLEFNELPFDEDGLLSVGKPSDRYIDCRQIDPEILLGTSNPSLDCLPKTSFRYVERLSDQGLNYHKSLLQLSNLTCDDDRTRRDSVIIDLAHPSAMNEVSSLSLPQDLADPDHFINTGFCSDKSEFNVNNNLLLAKG